VENNLSEKTESEIDEDLIKQAKGTTWKQGCLTRTLAAQILEIFLSDNDRYVRYQQSNVVMLDLTLDSCIVQTEELSAQYALDKFLKCSDRKFLALFHDFARFIEFYSEYDEQFMDEAKIALNKRKFEILGYRSKHRDFHMFNANRGRQLDVMESVWKESKAKLALLDEEYKTEFLANEIKKLKEYILKASAKENIDKTEHEEFFDVDPKWIDTSRMFLNYFDQSSGIEEEQSANAKPSRQIRNRVDLLMFSLENGNDEKVHLYKEKLFEFVKRRGVKFCPMHLTECFDRFQFVCPKGFYRLFIDIMKKTKVKLSISDNSKIASIDRIPIYIACVGAEITKYEPDILEEYLDTVISCVTKDQRPPNSSSKIRQILDQAIDQYVHIFFR